MIIIKGKRFKDVVSIGILLVSCLLLMLYIFDLRRPDVPLIALVGGDETGGMAGMVNFIETGSWTKNPRLGAPFGIINEGPISHISHYDFLVKFFLSKFIKRPGLLFNILFLYLFPAISLISYFVLRSLGINRIFAVLGGLTYAFSPYIMWRNILHLNLSAYLFVPLAILLCFWIYKDNDFLSISRTNGFFNYKRNIYALIFVILIASNGSGYYQAFSCYTLFIAGFSCLFIKGKRINFVKSAVLCVGIVLTLLLNITYGIINGDNTMLNHIAERSFQDAEVYGLKIIQLFLPLKGFGIDRLQAIIDRYEQGLLINENQAAYLGIIGCAGFILLLLMFFVDKKRLEYDLLSKLNLFLVLLGTIGGFGSIIALLFSAVLRCYNRVSIYIMFICIFALCLFVQEFIKERGARKRIVYYIITVLVFIFGIFEQATNTEIDFHLGRIGIIANFDADKEYYRTLENMNDKNAMIFQLPYQEFPESLTGYNFMIPYIHTKTLSWSAGSIRGTKGDRFYKNICNLPVQTMLKVLKEYNFSGIQLNKKLYSTIPEQFEKTTAAIENQTGGKPFIDSTGNVYYYSLKEEYIKEIASLIQPVFSDGFYDLEQSSNMQWRWAKQKAELIIIYDGSSTVSANLSFKIGPSLRNNFIRISCDNIENEYPMNEQEEIILNLRIPPGGMAINFTTDAPKVSWAPKDPRDLYFMLRNPVLSVLKEQQPVFSDGFYDLEQFGNMQWRWAKQKAELIITNDRVTTVSANLSFRIGPSLRNNFIRISCDNIENEYPMNEQEEITLNLKIPPGGMAINFTTDAPKVRVPQESRDLYFRLINPVLSVPKEQR
jgi:phosphoglycerol transferase